MTRPTHLATTAAVLVLASVSALADTLVLRSGEKVSGYFEGGSARVIKFRSSDGTVKEYDLLSVRELRFGDEGGAAAAPPAAPPAPAPPVSPPEPPVKAAVATDSAPQANASAEPRLVSRSNRPATPAPASASPTGWTVPAGSRIVIRMIDSVSSERNQIGDAFAASIDEPILQDGVEVVPRAAEVRGRVANLNEAGRVTGAAQLGLELTQVTVQGIPYSLTTSEYEQVGENRGGETAKRAATGAGIGLIIGAIAGGGKGAAIGAGVGGAGATAVQVFTKGEKLYIPSETKLEFTLRSPLVIARK